MLEAEKANFAGYSPGLLPDNMSSYSATGPDQVTLQLKQAYGSTWFTYNQLATLTPMPLAWDTTSLTGAAGSGGCAKDSAADGWAKCKAVYTFLNAQNKDTSTFATSPLWKVVDGPYHLTAYNVNGNFTFVPNPKYSGSPKASVTLKFVEYTSDTAVYTALKTGSLPVTARTSGCRPLTCSRPGRASCRRSTRWLRPATSLTPEYEYGIGYAYINFNNPTYGPVFKQLYFRQALMMLNNQQEMARPSAVATPTRPPRACHRSRGGNQFISSAMTANGGQGPYPYNPSKAEALLKSHGWQTVGGVLTCEGSCGGGSVAKGTQAKFAMQYTSGLSVQQDEADDPEVRAGSGGHPAHPDPGDVRQPAAEPMPCKPTASNCNWTFLYLGGWLFNGPGFLPTGEPLYQTGVAEQLRQLHRPEHGQADQRDAHQLEPGVFHNYANYTAQQVPSLWMPLQTEVIAV